MFDKLKLVVLLRIPQPHIHERRFIIAGRHAIDRLRRGIVARQLPGALLRRGLLLL